MTPAALYLSRLAPSGRRTMRAALIEITRIAGNRAHPIEPERFAWSRLRYADTQAIRLQLAERYAPATANKHLAALRGVLKECWRAGEISVEDYHRAADLQAVKADGREPKGRLVSDDEIRAAMGACGVRDAAILAILAGCGLRRESVAALDIEDANVREGELRVRHAKGGKFLLVPMPQFATERVKRWILEERLAPESPVARGPLFINSRGGRLSGQSIYDICANAARASSIPPFTPHDLRRSLVSKLIDRGADLVTVQGMVGHASIATTAKYDRRGGAASRRATELIEI